MKHISTGLGHRVYLSKNGEYVIKVANFPKDIKKIQEEIEYVKKQFGKFIPKTTCKKHHFSYILKQEYIDSLEHMSQENIAYFQNQFQELLSLNNKSIETTGKSLELVGSEGTIKCLLSELRKYKGSPFEKFFIIPFLKLLSKIKTTHNFLERWYHGAYPELSNIMVSKNGELKIVDIGISNHSSSNPLSALRGYAIEKWNEYFINKYFRFKKDS